MRDDPPTLGSIRAGVPLDFERILGRCLDTQPDHRFQTARELATELRALRRTLERGPAPATAAAPTPAPDHIAYRRAAVREPRRPVT